MEKRIVEILKSKISISPEMLFHIEKIEQLLSEIINIWDNYDIFYSIIILLKYGYVADLIVGNKNAINNINKTKYYIPNEKAFKIWDKIIDNEISEKVFNLNIEIDKKNLNGKVTFINKPRFKYSDDKNVQKGIEGEKKLYNLISEFHMSNYSFDLYGNYDIKFRKIEENFNKNSEYLYQTDYIITSCNQLFAIEMKNWNGIIEIDDYCNCYITHKNGEREYRKNPFSQNFNHASFLGKLLSEKLNINNVKISNLVVFGKNANLIKNNSQFLEDFVNYDGFHLYLQKKLNDSSNIKMDPELISLLITLSDMDNVVFLNSFNNSLFQCINSRKKEQLDKMIFIEEQKEKISEEIDIEITNYKNKKINEKKNEIEKTIDEDFELKKYEIEEKAKKKAQEEIYFNRCYLNEKSILESKKYLHYETDDIALNIKINNNGFVIKGLLDFNSKCNHQYSSIFAVIFNLLIKNSEINPKKDIPSFFNNCDKYHDINENYHIIFEYMIIILLLIKNNKYKNLRNDEIAVMFECSDISDELYVNYAIGYLNKILGIFLDLINADKIAIKYIKSNNILVGSGKNEKVHIYIRRNEKFSNKRNQIWVEKNIKYSINKEKHREHMLFILNEFFNLQNFRKGQVESIINILNNPGLNKLILLPTGSGKSLIFYFSILMQPKYSFVIFPTNILINNQIDNLEKKHKINNISTINNNNFILNENGQVIFITPEVLGKDNFIRNMLSVEKKMSIFSFVLDEVHCLSNKSHDFRVDYLTLAYRLKTFFNNATFIGLTATVDYSVLKELKFDLEIKDEDILESRIGENKVKFKIIHLKNELEIFSKCKSIIENSNDKTIVFVKNENVGKKLFDYLNNSKILLSQDKDDHLIFNDFDGDNYNVLIANYNLGIGIDMPNINRVIHIGVPFSVMDFVQQIGRIGRNGEYSESYILENITNEDLERIDYLEYGINQIKNSDILVALKQLFKDVDLLSKNQVQELGKEILIKKEKMEYYLEVPNVKYNAITLLILKELGLINYWENNVRLIKLSINENFNISLLQSNFRKYLSRNSDSNIIQISNIAEGIDKFSEYFQLTYKKIKISQLKYMMKMILKYNGEFNITNDIMSEFRNYFSLNFISLLSLEEKINEMSLEEINNKILNNVINKDFVSKISRIDNMNYNIEYIKFIADLKSSFNYIEVSKLVKKINSLSDPSNFIQGFIEILSRKIEDYDEYILFFLDILKGEVHNETLLKCISLCIEKIKSEKNKRMLEVFYLANSLNLNN